MKEIGPRYRFKIGEFDCLVINDGEFVGNAEMLFANAPEQALAQALHENGYAPDHLPSTWSCLLVKTPANVVLVDTGFGTGGAYGGQLLPALEAEGFKPQEIDTLILTHGHADHIGGCVDEAGQPIFPEATVYMWRDEWNFWTSETTPGTVSEWAANVARRNLLPLEHKINLIEAEGEIVPGVRVLAAPGHTVGHMAVEVKSDAATLLHMVDTALHPLQIEHPEWVGPMDQLPDETVATRRAMFQHAAEAEAMVLAFHFHPFPSLGAICETNGKWTWQPLSA